MSVSFDLENVLERLLTLEVLRYRLRKGKQVDTAAVMERLRATHLSPADICASLANEIADWIDYEDEDKGGAFRNSDRKGGRGWSSKVIHHNAEQFVLQQVEDMLLAVHSAIDDE